MAFEGNFTAVAVWVTLAALFDFLDGVFARLLKAYSDIGKELDSLADEIVLGDINTVLPRLCGMYPAS